MSYEATRADDGTYTIRDVPIFGEVPKGEKGAPFDIDGKWLKDALANLKQRESEGYLPPLHFHHHGFDETQLAGHFRATKVANHLVGGETIAVLFADLVKIPADKFSQIQANEYPFRSVEIVSYDEREIDTLALLDDDAPFFKFELLNGDTIKVADGMAVSPFGKSIDRITAKATHVGSGGFIRSAAGSAVLFCAHERPKEKQMKEFVINLENGTPTLFDDGKPVAMILGTGVAFAETETDDAEKIEEQIAMLQKRLLKLKKSKQGDDDEGDLDDRPDAQPAEPDGTPIHAAAAAGKIAALESRLASVETERAIEKREAVAFKKLKGWHLSDENRKRVRFFARKGDDLLTEFVDSFVANVPREPRELDDLGTDKSDPDEVLKFASTGPESLEAARSASNEYDQLRAAGMPMTATRAEFIETRHKELTAATA